MTGQLTRIGQEIALGEDEASWVLYKLKRGADTPLDAPFSAKKLRPVAYCRTRAVLMREISERGLTMTAQGATLIDGLPATFGGVLAAEAGAARAARGHRGAMDG
jgi:hypothetical protein